ncbi:MAG: bifunctional diaminohydroxyphosphoribosylaminopyrimidine deaminase/5-amino-6-(5-phosphoribosylamino)uracil reductase RibD [Polyangiales bacterium]
MSIAFDETMMRRAIDQAHRADRTAPNPRVGAVITDGQKVIATGYHRGAGLPHAEADAIANADGNTHGHTLYVTLEPCNHHGRTPPCTDAILNAGFSRVVIGALDPKPHVAGAIEKLRAQGIVVEQGVLRAASEALISDFRSWIVRGRPLVTAKAAITLDGAMATRTGDSKWITGPEARKHAHRLRAEHDAILVGIDTVLADDPRLDVRLVDGSNPVRVVLDGSLRTPPTAAVLTDTTTPTILVHGPSAPQKNKDPLLERGATFIEVPAKTQTKLDLKATLEELGKRNIMSLLVEGGSKVHGSFFDEQWVDRVALFVAPRILGDENAAKFPAGRGVDRIERATTLINRETEFLGPDFFLRGDVRYETEK